MYTKCDFVTCRKIYYNQIRGGLYPSFGTLLEDKIWNIPSSDTYKQNLCCHG